MERKLFKTLLKTDHKFYNNAYVRGRIYGIAEIICELWEDKTLNKKTCYGTFMTNNDGTIRYLETRCTEEQYERFKTYVEDFYPDLCEFYWTK